MALAKVLINNRWESSKMLEPSPCKTFHVRNYLIRNYLNRKYNVNCLDIITINPLTTLIERLSTFHNNHHQHYTISALKCVQLSEHWSSNPIILQNINQNLVKNKNLSLIYSTRLRKNQSMTRPERSINSSLILYPGLLSLHANSLRYQHGLCDPKIPLNLPAGSSTIRTGIQYSYCEVQIDEQTGWKFDTPWFRDLYSGIRNLQLTIQWR